VREFLQIDLSDDTMTFANSTSQLVRPVPDSQTATRFPVSVIILTFNESENIASCIEQLDWADEVILVDSLSDDSTVAIAKEVRPDLRVFSHAFRNFGDQRNWALEETQPRFEWVLFFDADEHCPPACAQAIQDAIENPGDKVGFYLSCRNFFLGRWIRRCTLYPSWQLRLLRVGDVRFRKEGHGQREVTDGPLAYIDEPYDHFGFSKGIAHWIERHNEYSTNECELISRLLCEPLQVRELVSRDPVVRRRCMKRLASHIGFRPLARFLYLYLFRRGFLEGRAGLVFSLLRLAHEIHILAKQAEADEQAMIYVRRESSIDS
jgi:glycosyltransferase involved in cell wall biosynthesis